MGLDTRLGGETRPPRPFESRRSPGKVTSPADKKDTWWMAAAATLDLWARRGVFGAAATLFPRFWAIFDKSRKSPSPAN